MKNFQAVFSLLVFVFLFLNPVFSKVTYLTMLSCEEFAAGNLLEWSTQNEQNSTKFIIEKSNDGVSFKETGIVKAAGFSTEKNTYSFLDVEPETKKVFYRLKQIDSDNSISLSHTVLMNKNLVNHFAILNINTTEIVDNFSVDLNTLSSDEMLVELLDETSTITLAKDIYTFEKGKNHIDIDMNVFPEGIYRVALTMGTEREILIINKVAPGVLPLQSSFTTKKKNRSTERKN